MVSLDDHHVAESVGDVRLLRVLFRIINYINISQK
jgi:hypothetical protein